MAKTRAPSKHSRAARRATSPSIDTDKSLKDIRPPPRSASSASTHRSSVLAVHRAAGVQKKAKTGRKSQMSAKARRRQEKGLQMAEAVVERTSKKKEKSFGRARNVHERAKNWDEINRAAEGEKEAAEGGDAQMDGVEAAGDEAWETDPESDQDGNKVMGGSEGKTSAQDGGGAPQNVDDDDDEIL